MVRLIEIILHFKYFWMTHYFFILFAIIKKVTVIRKGKMTALTISSNSSSLVLFQKEKSRFISWFLQMCLLFSNHNHFRTAVISKYLPLLVQLTFFFKRITVKKCHCVQQVKKIVTMFLVYFNYHCSLSTEMSLLLSVELSDRFQDKKIHS